MKRIFSVLLLLFALSSFAQKPSAAEVLEAEKSFAAYSVAHGTKDAFLKFLDSNSVVFEKGKAVNGLETWNKKEKSSGVLNWHPVYGCISTSGDLGFTTGPWTFQEKNVKDSIVARGQYSTVWKKNQQGGWKALVDLGNNNVPSLDDMRFTTTDETEKFIPGTWNNLLNREQKFIARTKAADNATRRRLYEEAASRTACFLNRNGQWPSRYGSEASGATANMPAQIEYTIDGSGISTAGDLGYVYGTTVVNKKTDNYLRIWRREGREWKLMLEVLRY